MLVLTSWGEGVLNEVLYGEAPPRGPTPYPFIYQFFQKRYSFRIPSIENGTPFTYLLKNTGMQLMNDIRGEQYYGKRFQPKKKQYCYLLEIF